MIPGEDLTIVKKRRIINPMIDDRLNDPHRFTPLKCPTCNGFGTVTNKRIKCHGCGGYGFVVIDQQIGRVVSANQKEGKGENPDFTH